MKRKGPPRREHGGPGLQGRAPCRWRLEASPTVTKSTLAKGISAEAPTAEPAKPATEASAKATTESTLILLVHLLLVRQEHIGVVHVEQHALGRIVALGVSLAGQLLVIAAAETALAGALFHEAKLVVDSDRAADWADAGDLTEVSEMSSRASDAHARKVTTVGEDLDMQVELSARLPFDEHPRPRTRRGTRPAQPRLETRGAFMSCRA